MDNQTENQNGAQATVLEKAELLPKIIAPKKLIKETWAIYRQNFSLLLKIMAWPTALMFISALIGGPLGFLLYLISLIGLVWSQIALIDFVSGRPTIKTVKELYDKNKIKLWPLVWLMIISMLIIMGALFLFVVPGLLFSFWFMFALVVAVLEGDRGFSALLKSREYTRHYFWPIVGRYALLIVAFGFVYGILQNIFVGLSTNTSLVVAGLPAVITLLFTPLASVYLLLIYESIKAIKGSVIATDTKMPYLLTAIFGWVFFFLAIILAIFLVNNFVG